MTLYYSLLLCNIISVVDIYFNLNIKSLLLGLGDELSTLHYDSLKNFLLKMLLDNSQNFKAGMYSGLYNRGISVIIIFNFILGAFL